MLSSRISNLPFLDGADDMYATTNKSHFKLDTTVMLKRDIILQPVSPQFQHCEEKYLGKYRTETAPSLPSQPPVAVIQPKQTHLTMQRTNFKLHSEDRCGDFETTQSELKQLPMCAAKKIRPTTAVRTSLPEDKYPEPIYRSSYIKHKVSRNLRAKQSAKTGVGSSLIMDRRDRFRSSYHEQFQYRWFPHPPQSAEKYSSVAMGDQEETLDKKPTYSTSFRQSGDHSSAEFKKCLLPKINKYRPINLREIPDDQWTTTSSEEFCHHKYGPIHLERRCPTLSFVFKGETLTGDQERLFTTNQCFFPKIKCSQFPVHVDGASIRNLSDVKFGRPDFAGIFYSTTTQEQFPPKEEVRPKPPVYPPSHVLFEQEPDQMLTTMQNDFVPLNCKRQKMSPSQLQQVKGSHIRPRHSKHDLRTTYNKTFVPKPYCKASLEKPPLQHISHMPF
ncbi:Pantothenate kinase [Labeo rohita]|uniref:Pantothenate kinase n=1 Tax=Labeo rohita TaxID=84645 RepID=A0ABQ8M964_LABRO|nr:Pantothenate kinase [Labeo rohita]